MESVIPPATAQKLAAVHPEGTRHQAAMDIAFSLIGQGLSGSAVFAQLRSTFDAGVSDKELSDVVRWCEQQRPEPCHGRNGNGHYRSQYTAPQPKKRTHLEQAEWWCKGARMTPDDLRAQSPVSIPDDPKAYLALALSSLYRKEDNLNVMTKFTLEGDKCRPFGAGRTLARDSWVWYVEQKGVPSSEAGAWVRINPCSTKGSGKEGAYTDADITRCEYVLVESDTLPLELQLALFRRWNISTVAVIMSGGHSAHAWVRVRASDAKAFETLVERLFTALEPFGFDQANKNPSRLCRLPGSIRVIGGVNGGEQRLIWLNPDAQPLTAESLESFKSTLAFQFDDGFPLKDLARSAVKRYQDMYENRGKLGVPTGIPELDNISGGWKNGQTIILTGETGGGKSTLGLHCVCAALDAGIGVLLFSLEMDGEEIFDMMMSKICEVNRNCFNTGYFNESDIPTLIKKIGDVAKLPLYVEDSSIVTPEQIKARVFQLKDANRIGLVVVDYVQFVTPGLSKDTREQQVAGISHMLRTIARESKLPMIVISQINEDGRARESRVIEHNANVVIHVEVSGDDVKASVVKGRGIPLGEYHLKFDRIHARLIPTPADRFDQIPVHRQGDIGKMRAPSGDSSGSSRR